MKFSGLIALAVALPLAAQQRTITCAAATNGQPQTCNADTRNGVLLVREMSNNVCRQGDTWSYDRRGITVRGGCSAAFLTVARRGNDGGYGDNGYGDRDRDRRDGYGENGYGQGNASGRNDGPDRGGYPQDGRPAAGRMIVPGGSMLRVRLEQSVRLAQLQPGTLLSGVLDTDLRGNGGVFPAGSRVVMKVYSQQGQAMDLRLDSLTANGQSYNLQSAPVSLQQNEQANTGLGGFLNALAGGGVLQAGTIINFQTTAEVR